MKQALDASMVVTLLVLHEQGLSYAEISERIGATQETIKEFIALAESSAVEAPSMTDAEAIAELADAVQRRDDIASFSILEEGRKNIRWVNPLQLDGAQQLKSLQADMQAQAAICQSEQRPVEDRAFIVLPTELPPSWLTAEFLSALILQAKRSLVLVASRAVLQKVLFDSA